MNKPILFLSSSRLVGEIENLYKLLKLGKILDLTDDSLKDEDVARFAEFDFIICDLKNDNCVKRLRLINPALVCKVCVVRKWESAEADFVAKLKPEFTIKEFSFIKECKTKAEVFNYIQHLDTFKKPLTDCWFYLKKLSFLLSCFKSD